MFNKCLDKLVYGTVVNAYMEHVGIENMIDAYAAWFVREEKRTAEAKKETEE